jgi:hypothetical protein
VGLLFFWWWANHNQSQRGSLKKTKNHFGWKPYIKLKFIWIPLHFIIWRVRCWPNARRCTSHKSCFRVQGGQTFLLGKLKNNSEKMDKTYLSNWKPLPSKKYIIWICMEQLNWVHRKKKEKGSRLTSHRVSLHWEFLYKFSGMVGRPKLD